MGYGAQLYTRRKSCILLRYTMRRLLSSLAVLSLLFLGACKGSGTTSSHSEKNIETTAPKTALKEIVTFVRPDLRNARPSAMLGLFLTFFLSKNEEVAVQSALRGIGAEVQLIEERPEDIEKTFALLQSLGTILQTDVPDTLNRTTDRPAALNAYTATLKGTIDLSVEQVKELEAKLETLRTEENAARENVSGIQRTIDTAVRNQDYSVAGSQQKAITDAKAKLSSLEAERDRTNTLRDIFKKLLDIASKRMAAVEQNREILIAGLAVTDLPGIEDLGILKNAKDSNGRSIFGL